MHVTPKPRIAHSTINNVGPQLATTAASPILLNSSAHHELLKRPSSPQRYLQRNELGYRMHCSGPTTLEYSSIEPCEGIAMKTMRHGAHASFQKPLATPRFLQQSAHMSQLLDEVFPLGHRGSKLLSGIVHHM
jgi:hypothetical protein